ncbi:PKD domain-containing protein [Rhodocytophaga aerolata]|uniref:PKD domain-containing protein n=1 Tax=Rhodocytophaga aerolata TaxID=455078 RepID=UPI003610F848
MDGLSVQNSATNLYISSSLTNGQTVTVRVSTANDCSVLSTGITTTVNAVPVLTLTSSDADNIICQGETVTFTASSTVAASFDFLINGSVVQSGAANTFTTTGLTNGQTVMVRATTTNSCAALSSGITITVNSMPVVTLVSSDADNAICQGETVTFTASSTVAASFDFLINGSVVQSGTANTFTTTGLTNGQTVTVRATTASGCSTLSSGITTTVNAVPVLTLTSSDADNIICQGETVTFTASSSIPVSNYKFYVNGTLVQDGAFPTYLTSGLTNGQTVTVRATTASGCSILSSGITTTVNPLPTVVLTSSDVDNIICQGETVTFKANSATATTYEFFVDGLSVQNSATNLYISSALTNGQTVTVRVSTANACSILSAGITTAVNDLPSVTLTSSDADNIICQGETVTFKANSATATTYEFFVDGVSVQNSATNLYISSALTNGQTVKVRATTASGCFILSSGITTTVNPLPVITLTSSDADNIICQEETVTFTANSASASNYKFYINGTLVQEGAFPTYLTSGLTNGQTVTVRATTASGCSTLSSGITTTVNPLPTVVLTSSDADNIICQGETVTFTANSSTAVRYEFFVDGAPVQNSPSNKYTTSSLVNGQSIRVLVTTAASCQATSNPINFQVNPVVTVNAGADMVVCEGEPIVLTGTSSLEGNPVTVTWSGGLGIFNDIHLPSATYTPAPSEIGKTVVLTLTTVDPDGAGPCSEVADQVRVQINALPTVIFTGLGTAYCIDAASSELTGFPAGGVFSGKGIDNSIAGKNFFIPSLAGVGTHIIRYTYTDANACTNYFERSVVVHPLPSVSFTGFNSTGPGGTAQYPQDAPSIVLTGSPAGGFFTGKGLSANVFNAGAAGPGTHVIRYTYNDENGCVNFQDQTVTVLPLPEVGIGTMPDQFCSKDPDYLMTGTPAGGTFSGPGVIGGTTVFRPSNAFIGANTIRYTYKDPVSGGTNFIEKTIILYKVPDVTFSGLNASYCVDGAHAELNGFPADNDGPGGVLGVFKGPGVYPGAVEGSYLFNPRAAGTGTHRITYVFTNENGCTDSTSKQVIVYDLPLVTFSGLESLYCVEAPSAKLVGFPSGGNFSGTGISGNSFIPSLAGPGIHTITYTYTNSNGCTSTQQQQVTIYPMPVANFRFEKVCDNDEVSFSDLTPTTGSGAITAWEWNFGDPVSGSLNTSNEQNPFHLFTGPGTYSVTLKVVSAYGCENTKTMAVTIGSIPKPDFSWSGICLGESVQFTHQSTVSFSTITEWDWNFGDGTSNKVFSSTEQVAHPYASPGRYIVTLTVKTNLGCTNSIAKEIYVLPSVNTYPYFENFETTNGGWIQDGIQSSWEHGKPAGSTIAYAASGTNAWITGLATSYNINEKSYVYSPCFDFSKLTKPMISLNIWNHTQQGFDGAVLQSSVDGGLTWFNVGTIGEGINWYNQSAIIGNPGNQVIGQNGWSGMDDQWQSAKFALDNLKGYTSVRFRIAFGSNNDNPPNQILDGFAFDDVYIGERDRTVLLEHFTNSSSTEALEENAFINRLSVDTDEVVSIQYHTNFPGADPLNEVNPADPSARALFYGIPQSPRTAIDGYTVNQKFSGWGLPILSRRKLTETAFKIDVAFPVTADQYLTIKTDLTALLNVSDTLTVHVAVVEKQLTNLYDGAPVFHNVLRKMLPNAAGTKFTRTWQPGDTHSMEVSWQPVNIKDASQLAVVVFIQNDRTKEIYQAIFKQPSVIPTIITGMEPAMAETNTFTLYPNPATQKTSISFNQPVTQEYTWTIYDVVGRKIAQGVLAKGQKEVLIDVASYAEGSYVVHLSSRNKSSWYKKLLILHNK